MLSTDQGEEQSRESGTERRTLWFAALDVDDLSLGSPLWGDIYSLKLFLPLRHTY